MWTQTIYIDWLKWEWQWQSYFIKVPYNIISSYSWITGINKGVIKVNDEISFEIHYRQWSIHDPNKNILWKVAIQYKEKSIRK